MTILCNLKDGWDQFLEFAEKRTTPTEFQNWLAPIQLMETTDEEILLKVPNIFVQEYLLSNYKSHLCDFLPLRSKNEPAIRFIIAQTISPVVKKPKQKINTSSLIKLNSYYTFENFIEGPSNQFVKSAALGISARPGKSYNPLFIHGGVGLGKTHLLHAIGHHVQSHKKQLKIQCITTEAFIHDLVDHLKNKSIDKMKKFYRNLDILLVDDIQFLQNRHNFEEEFSNTFESLIHQNKQIVITSDKPPSQLKLSERIIARMEWGLVANIGAPDLETRVAIIQQKAEQKKLSIEDTIAFFIAEHIYVNVRQIEGAINRLCAHCKLMNVELTLEVVENILSEIIRHNPEKKISVENILKVVSSIFEVRVSEIKGESRQKLIAIARQVAMYLAKELIEESLSKIASAFGGKTHSTLIHSWKKIHNEIKENLTLRRQIDLAKRNLTV